MSKVVSELDKEFDCVKLGLKCGLEIHQQLNTKKLFCSCPSVIRDDDPDFVIKRFLRVSAGESGLIDKAAKAENKKQKHFLYEGYYDTTCLVELDEEPPHNINEEALTVALQVAKMLKAKTVDNLRIMRKTVVDGSNTSGFQRTALVGVGGEISGVGIESVCLEEDAAKIVEKDSGFTKYNLSRLGIPLIEIATAPDIKTPNQAKEVALAIGMFLRSTGKAKRGIGTIRQDLNVSIKDGLRVELKGVQDVKILPDYVKNEVRRQYELINIFKELRNKKAKVSDKVYDLKKIFSNTKAKVIKSALSKKDGTVYAIKLSGFNSYLGREIQPGRRFGSELSDYAKTQGVKGLFHGDELPNYGLTDVEVKKIKSEITVGLDDSFILIADEETIAKRAIETVISRLKKLELIKEVRQARPDGTSCYLRPMPGANRMYPETDVPSIDLDVNIKNIVIPELLTDKEIRFKKQYGLQEEFARQLAKEGIDFDSFVKKYSNVSPMDIAQLILTYPKDLKKRYGVVFAPFEFENYLRLVLSKLNSKIIPMSSSMEILMLLSKKNEINWDNFKLVDESAIKKVILQVIKEDPSAPIGALMGVAMKNLRGKADGKTVMRLLKENMG